MPKLYGLFTFLPLVSLILAISVTLACLTQAMNIQVIIFRNLYWIMDNTWGIARAVAFLFVAVIASAMAVVYPRVIRTGLSLQVFGYMFAVSLCGLVLGLVVHYADVCCDSPVIFYFGFPLSWALGVSDSWHYLTTSTTAYLVQNFRQFNWRVVPWNLAIGFFFWFDVSFLLYSVPRLGKVLGNKKSNLQLE